MPKGGDWERECAKQLSLWWTNGERDDTIWRTSGSGSRFTTRRKQGIDTYNAAGDLCATDPIAQPLFDFLLIECKRGYAKGRPSESINVLYWLDRPPGTKAPLLYQWWEKANQERIAAKRSEAVIIFKRTGKRACIMMDGDWYHNLLPMNGPYKGTVIDIQWDDGAPGMPETWRHRHIVIADLRFFLDWCPPETIRQMQVI
ncbi:hypothetical protein LCGC14_1348160 [marine sediment metagenome]|uniref:Uncharacterized protein n=1 Tax=marine sediment metagenome TaxID=412755 RepID=A0A0F9KCB0_9ZZZZ